MCDSNHSFVCECACRVCRCVCVCRVLLLQSLLTNEKLLSLTGGPVIYGSSYILKICPENRIISAGMPTRLLFYNRCPMLSRILISDHGLFGNTHNFLELFLI